jgi:hypothetical protein
MRLESAPGEVRRSRVIPNLNAGGAKQEYLAVVYDQRNHIVGVAFSTCKVQRVYRSPIKQAGNPELLRVWFVEYEVPVKVADRSSAGKSVSVIWANTAVEVL